MLRALLGFVVVGVSLSALAGAVEEKKDLRELSGTLRKLPKGDKDAYLLDLDGCTGSFALRGEALEAYSEKDRVWVRGIIQTRLFTHDPEDETPQQQPEHWQVFMVVHECTKTANPFERPKRDGQRGHANKPPTEAPQPVHPSQLGSVAIPSGRLGHPLGTYLTIEGIRMEKGKVRTRTLRVDTVNGQKLAKPVGVWVDNVKNPGLPKGTRCVIRGYESGKMIGVPHAVAKAENRPLPQAGWQFRRYFIMTSVVEPKSLEKE